MSAVKAAFRRGIPLVDLDKIPAIPCCLIFQLGHELRPTHVTDSFCQTVVLDHVLDVQALNADRLVFTNQPCRELVQEVTASISDTSMDTSNLLTGFGSILATLLLPGMSSLGFGQFLLVFVEEFGVPYRLTCREDDELFQAQVSPNGLFNRLKLCDIFFYQERHKVAVSTVFGDSDTAWYCTIGQRTAPTNVQRFGHLCQGELGAIPLERIRCVGSRLPTTLLLEGGILGTSLKEIEKRLVQVTQGLLQGNRRDLRKPGACIGTLEIRQGLREVFIRQALVLLVEGICLLAQSPIVHETSTAKGASKNLFLLICWVTSVLVCSFLFHFYMVT